MITPEQIKARYPVFCEVQDAHIQEFIDDAECAVNQSFVESFRNRLLKTYTAHLLGVNYIVQTKLMVATLSIEAEKSIKVDLFDSRDDDKWFNLTPYGKEYLYLLKRNTGTIGAFAI